MRYPILSTLLALCLLVVFALPGCEDRDKARETLENYGFTDIQVGGFAPFRCGDDYTFANEFKATNFQGRHVEGVVCCGFVKGCTVKF